MTWSSTSAIPGSCQLQEKKNSIGICVSDARCLLRVLDKLKGGHFKEFRTFHYIAGKLLSLKYMIVKFFNFSMVAIQI